MRKFLLFILLLCLPLVTVAQQSREEMKQNILLSASNYLAYPGPSRQLTPTPKGYTPYYISHFGRHGSRYMIGEKGYDRPYGVLLKADSLGKLTAKGKELLRVTALLRDEAMHRDGELTRLGAEQHQQIARRMMERFPEVFAGRTHIDARSTIIIRSILSMSNELMQMKAMNPQLDIVSDASMHDMWYMKNEEGRDKARAQMQVALKKLESFLNAHSDYNHLMGVIFNDADYVRSNVNITDFGERVVALAHSIQNTDYRNQLNLYDLFTFDELYNYWQCINAKWYVNYGPDPTSKGIGMYIQANLLRNIIDTADTCLTKKHPGVTLRFGHDSNIMPLACLLNLNGYGKPRTGLEQLDDENWIDYKVYPMGCNIQFIFYRPLQGDKDILFKVLLNEDEATLPDLKPVEGPYYKWKDFREFFLKKLENGPDLN